MTGRRRETFDRLRPNGVGDFRECFDEFAPKQAEVALHPARTSDQHMIRTAHATFGQELARKRAKAPLHPITDDGVADLLGDRESDPDRGIVILTIPNQQHEARHRGAPAGIGRDEIRAAGKRD
jgi:hypothetical protein